jgi:hypothetical protein
VETRPGPYRLNGCPGKGSTVRTPASRSIPWQLVVEGDRSGILVNSQLLGPPGAVGLLLNHPDLGHRPSRLARSISATSMTSSAAGVPCSLWLSGVAYSLVGSSRSDPLPARGSLHQDQPVTWVVTSVNRAAYK